MPRIGYGFDKKTEKNILVCNLGGGSVDASLLTIDNGVLEVVAMIGRVWRLKARIWGGSSKFAKPARGRVNTKVPKGTSKL